MPKPIKKCPFCLLIQGQKPHEVIITQNSKFLVIPDQLPSSKGHSLLISREHLPHLSEMPASDWNQILPLFKETLNRLNNHFSPQGFNCYFWTGREEDSSASLQSVPHFHINLVPIYQKEYGLNWFVTRINQADQTSFTPTAEEYQETIEKLQPNSQGIIQQTNHLTLKLVSAEEALIPGHLVIQTKGSLSNSIFAITPELWNQIGELLQTTIQNLKTKFLTKNIQVELPLGKASGPEQQTLTEFQIHILPFQTENYTYQKPEQKSREYLRIARKLAQDNPEELAYKQVLRKAKLETAKTYWIEKIHSSQLELPTNWETKLQELDSLLEVKELAQQILLEKQESQVLQTTFNPNK
jgi:histidine triad (HIT) family protein